ncbi:MAG: twin-arginine translocation signal domain-containing protein, partial [Actinobacteria bacterium]|nr:twin-arginine translocation signal domain-containing protein [Actinomycetota bacterium]
MLVYVLLAALVGAALLGAATLKVADRTGTAVAAETFGLRGRPARWVWLPLAALEALLAAGLIGGARHAGWAAAGLLGAFAIAQAAAIAAGRSGAPCGCFGARGHLSWGSVARAALLAAAAVLVALAPAANAPPLFATTLGALALAVAIVVRARRPAGALEVAGEGPPLGSRLDAAGVPLALFTSDGCRLCRALIPQARRLGGAVYDEIADAEMWSAAGVPGAPFAVALAGDGTVLAKGTVNTRAQLSSVVAAADGRRSEIEHPERASSRRSFLQTASAAVAVLTAGRMVGSLVAPGEADAFHFCGHIYTTDGCPHPTGLPRIDRHGYPLRARDGRPVDDLGRRIGADGAPLDEAGAPLLDPDGRPQPPATRTR